MQLKGSSIVVGGILMFKKTIVGMLAILVGCQDTDYLIEDDDQPETTACTDTTTTSSLSDDTVSTAPDDTTPVLPPEETDPPTDEPADPWNAKEDQFADEGYHNYNLVSVDEHGRVSTASGAEISGRNVGMFMHMSYGFSMFCPTRIYNIEDLIAAKGANAVFKETSIESPLNQSHYWGEPLYGYYRSNSPYVIHRQLELFMNIGVDFLILDVTNAWIFDESTAVLLGQICELRKEGWDAPQVVFYVHSRNNQTVREIYSKIYTAMPQYSPAWYRKNGKPVIIAYDDNEKNIADALGSGYAADRNDPICQPLEQEIMNFFCFVEPRWPNDFMLDPTNPMYDAKNEAGNYHGWEWIDWNLNLKVRDTTLGTYMNAAVASHPNMPFSFSYTRGVLNYGRGFDRQTGQNTPEGCYTGTHYQSCWSQIIRRKPDNVMITMWNSWDALKHLYDGEYIMADTCTFEYSTTIEPAKGYYKDSYVLQTLQNTRRYKYEDGRSTYPTRSIDIHGKVAQWYTVGAVYRQIGTKFFTRDDYSNDRRKTYHYVVEAPANHIQESRLAHDDAYIYMMIRTENAITDQSGEDWMNVFLGTGDPSLKGWNGYEYVINRKAICDGKTAIEKLNGDYTGTVCGEAEVVVRGAFMFLKIPKSAVGLNAEKTFYFKVADSVVDADDIMSYYTTGSTMPVGRFSYSYTAE